MKQNAKELLEKYQLGTCTAAEQALVERYLNKQVADSELLPSAEGITQSFSRLDAAFDKITKSSRRSRTLRLIPYAAAAILAVAIGALVVSERWPLFGDRQLAATEIQPGGNRATLTLADGRVVQLDEAQTGIIVGTENITYTDGSNIALSPAGGGRGRFDEIKELVLSTPKGGTYQITLPDGSKVWLNSETTLTYPNFFDDNERVVDLVGEGYFEIKNDAKRLFRVRSDGQTIEVLGTQFNISAYADETETKTTLVEGRVRVGMSSAGGGRGRSLELTPGEQAAVTAENLTKAQVDVTRFTAWRDGKFDFSEQTLETIMRQISRWYDVEVEYDGVDRQEQYWGSVSRFSDITQVLDKLEQTGDIRFAVKERRVTVSKAIK